MAEKHSRWENLIAGVLISLLLLFAIAMMVAVVIVYWYGMPAA